MGQKHVLTVPGRYQEIRKICQFVKDGATRSGLDETAVFHIELACDEACTNIIEHAYSGEDGGDINVSWQISKEMFVITIKDNGDLFNPDSISAPPLVKNRSQLGGNDDVQVGGLGLHFMRELMDEVDFTFELGRGNQLVMKKRIQSEGGS